MNHTKDGAWLFALQAAKTSVTLYGIWLGHVYHWHIVTAAMQRTMYDMLPQGHDIYQLLQAQSNYLIGFDSVLLNKSFWKVLEFFSKIAPPSCIGDPDAFLKLLHRENSRRPQRRIPEYRHLSLHLGIETVRPTAPEGAARW
jgi:hypothetical protein